MPTEHGGTITRGFLFADLRGYTAFVEERGAAAAAELLTRYRALVREAIGRFGGAEIKTEGDSFYVVFDSVSSAVRCGLAIVAEAKGGGADEQIRVGIGVHAGETIEADGGYVGSPVNIAARICAQAGPAVATGAFRAGRRRADPGRRCRGPRLAGVAPVHRAPVGEVDDRRASSDEWGGRAVRHPHSQRGAARSRPGQRGRSARRRGAGREGRRHGP